MSAKHEKGKAGHPKATAAEADPDAGAAALARLEARIRAAAPAPALTLDVEAAAVTALGVANAMTGDAETHAALKAMSRIEVGGKKVFDVRSADDLGDLALAVRELRKRADAAIAKASRAKLSAALVAEAKTLEKTMQRVCENTLEGVADDDLAALSPGSDYLDLASDLEGYASLYDRYPARVKLDGVRYDAGHPARARAIAQEMLAALGAPLDATDRDAIDLLRRGFGCLDADYAECRRVGVLLAHGDARAEAAYPSLFSAGRKPRKPAAAKPQPDPQPAPTPAPQAPTTTPTSDGTPTG